MFEFSILLENVNLELNIATETFDAGNAVFVSELLTIEKCM